MDKPNKVQDEDIPKILAAIKTAIDSKQRWTLTVSGTENGGIIGINLKLEKTFK